MKIFITRCVICLIIFLTIHTYANAAGVIDRSFGTNGAVVTPMNITPQSKAVLVQPDGKIVVVGNALPTVAGSFDVAFARYNANGTLDSTFAFGGRGFVSISSDDDIVTAAALQPDGKIVIVGSTEPTPGSTNTDFFVLRLNSNGSVDSQFGNLGVITVNQGSNDIFYSVAVQPDGKIVAAGRTSDGDRSAVIRFNENGSLDQSFANGGLLYFSLATDALNETATAVRLLQNGRILIGGTAIEFFGLNYLALFESNGTPATDFGINGFVKTRTENTPGPVLDLAILPDGKILTVSRDSLRRYLSDGSLDPNFRSSRVNSISGPGSIGTNFAVRPDGKILVLNQISSAGIDTVVYEKNGRAINGAVNLKGAGIAVQSDNKFIVISSEDNNFIVKRYISISSQGTRITDFDYDGKTDFVVLRDGQTAYVLRSLQTISTYQINRNANETIRIMPEDYQYATPSLFPLFYWRSPQQNAPSYFESINANGTTTTFQWGTKDDIPVGGDYDGESSVTEPPPYRRPAEFAIFRPSTGDWWIYNLRSNTYSAFHWGANGDKPVPADYDYDGITDFAVYRPLTGTWWIHRSSDDTYFTIQFGVASDIPLTGDYDGDGKADFTVYRASESNWYQYLTTEGFRIVRFGLPTDIPVPGDYDGDGKMDIAVYREGIWYLLQSTEGLKFIQWGNATDVPVAVRYDQ